MSSKIADEYELSMWFSRSLNETTVPIFVGSLTVDNAQITDGDNKDKSYWEP
jgi:hypothetical protein